MFLETLVDFIIIHKDDLQDWLFVLLTKWERIYLDLCKQKFRKLLMSQGKYLGQNRVLPAFDI